MKKLIMCLVLLAFVALPMLGNAEVIIVGQTAGQADTQKLKLNAEMTMEDICSFTVKDVKVYDVFMNQQSGSSKQFIVASFDLLNWQTEQLFVKAQTDAKLIYDEDFEFEAAYLWANPEGAYYRTDGEQYLYIYKMDENGKIYSNGTDNNGGYVNPSVKYHSGYVRVYDPINVSFYHVEDGNDSVKAYRTVDSSKTVLDPLVERTYHYVFLVPDIVAEDEGLRELIFTVEDSEYSMRF